MTSELIYLEFYGSKRTLIAARFAPKMTEVT